MAKRKTCPSANADTDHTLVWLKFKLKPHKIRKSKAQPCFDFSQREQLQLKLQNRFQLSNTPDTADPLNCVDANVKRQQLKVVLTETAKKTLRKQVRTVKK